MSSFFNFSPYKTPHALSFPVSGGLGHAPAA